MALVDFSAAPVSAVAAGRLGIRYRAPRRAITNGAVENRHTKN